MDFLVLLALCDAVRAVAIDRVIMAAVANQNIAVTARNCCLAPKSCPKRMQCLQRVPA